MMKVLLLVAVIAIAVWMLTTKSRLSRRQDKPPAPKGRADSAKDLAPQNMVRCAHCGVHLPAGDAVKLGSNHFCGEAHSRLGPATETKASDKP